MFNTHNIGNNSIGDVMYIVTCYDADGNRITDDEPILIDDNLCMLLYDVMHEKTSIFTVENHEKASWKTTPNLV